MSRTREGGVGFIPKDVNHSRGVGSEMDNEGAVGGDTMPIEVETAEPMVSRRGS